MTEKKDANENFDVEADLSQEETCPCEDHQESQQDCSCNDNQQTDSSAKEQKDDNKSDKKKMKKASKKDKKDEMIDDLNDRVKRQMAEFENFRKRSEKEKGQMYDMGAKNIVEKILPILDNFERGLAQLPEGEDNAFLFVMKMVYKQLETSLQEAGVSPIEAVGQEFNPEYHNAVMHIDDENYGECEVVEELQKGYLYHDSVVRHSMVKVAN